MFSHFSCVLFPQLLSQGGMDVPALLAEVTWMWEAATAVEVVRAIAMLTTKTSTWDFVVAQDSVALHVTDAKDWATLIEREALERVSREEAENAMTLASTREDAEGLA
jgi:hypothetical protein